ncbi:MAG: GAF and ANTAR domain-containing protein [Mycobacteriaceae bacterium]
MTQHAEEDTGLGGLAVLAQEFTQLVELLYEGEPTTLTTARIVEVAAHAVGAAEHAALTVMSNGELRTEATTSATATTIDQITAEVGHGPVFDSMRTSSVVVAHDLAADDTHWPKLGRRLIEETSVRSILACRILISHEHKASLNLYSSWPHAFDDHAVPTTAILASYCSLALYLQLLDGGAAHPDRLRESHREVGIAIGLLMARHDVSADRAYADLRRASTALNKSLSYIASQVTGRS